VTFENAATLLIAAFMPAEMAADLLAMEFTSAAGVIDCGTKTLNVDTIVGAPASCRLATPAPAPERSRRQFLAWLSHDTSFAGTPTSEAKFWAWAVATDWSADAELASEQSANSVSESNVTASPEAAG
jgi:hypothetical protein